MDVLCEFIAKTQPKEWAKYTKYYGDNAPGKLYHRLETTITNQGLLYVLRNGIEDMGCKLKVCFFKPESDLNPLATERYEANILGCTLSFVTLLPTPTPSTWCFPSTVSPWWHWS